MGDKIKFIFGKPNEGLHKYRICNIAIVDYILAIILSIFLTCITKYPVEIVTIFVFLTGIILHYLVGL
jgi:hypothetical protein